MNGIPALPAAQEFLLTGKGWRSIRHVRLKPTREKAALDRILSGPSRQPRSPLPPPRYPRPLPLPATPAPTPQALTNPTLTTAPPAPSLAPSPAPDLGPGCGPRAADQSECALYPEEWVQSSNHWLVTGKGEEPGAGGEMGP